MNDPLKDTQRASWNAAKKNMAKKERRVLALLREKGPLATFEVSAGLKYDDRQGAAPTLCTLEKDGEIVDTGERRMNPRSGKKNAVYAIKPKPLIQVTLA